MMWPEWFDCRKIFREGDLTDPSYVCKVHADMERLREELDQKKLIREIEADICIEKRRYSVGNKLHVPFGYYNPSEVQIINTINVQRGRLLLKAKNPSFIYDYDSSGNVVRICQVENHKIFTTVHCIRKQNAEIRLCWSQDMIDDCCEAQYDEMWDNCLSLIVRDEEGNLLINSFTFFIDGLTTRVEVYGKRVHRKQNMSYYSLGTDRNGKADMILRTKRSLIYDATGKMVEVLSGGQEMIIG